MFSRKSIANDRASTDRHPVFRQHRIPSVTPHWSSLPVPISHFANGWSKPPESPARVCGEYPITTTSVNGKKRPLAQMAEKSPKPVRRPLDSVG